MTTMNRPIRALAAVFLALPLVAAAVVACSADQENTVTGAAASASADAPTTSAPVSTAPVEDIVVEAADFPALKDMTPVRGFFVANLLGHLDATLAVANNPDGGAYPVGTLIQLVPQEAMVKRAPGFDPLSNDWEFFGLTVAPDGTTVTQRGGSEVINRFGGSCVECHARAEPKFDLVCEDTHGCEPLPIGKDIIKAIQASDPRPAKTAS